MFVHPLQPDQHPLDADRIVVRARDVLGADEVGLALLSS